jgi:hypothetical protein
MPSTAARAGAVARAERYFDEGGFLADLRRRVAIPTTSQEADAAPALERYLAQEMAPSLEALGYRCSVRPNPVARFGPFLVARRTPRGRRSSPTATAT